MSISPPFGQFGILAVQNAGQVAQTLKRVRDQMTWGKVGLRSGNPFELCDDENIVEGLDGLKTNTVSRGRIVGQIIGTEPGATVVVGQLISRCCGIAHVTG